MQTTDNAFNRSVSHNVGSLICPTYLWSFLAFANSTTRAFIYGFSLTSSLFLKAVVSLSVSKLQLVFLITKILT